MRHPLPRPLTFRYIGALLAVAGLLLAGQLVVQRALEHQEDDSRIVNTAGRQRMLSQRLAMLLLAGDRETVRRVADEWEASQAALRGRENSETVEALFAAIDHDHRAMLAAARAGEAREVLGHEEAFLAGMDRIVAEYAREARERVVGLRRLELLLFVLALVVLALEGAFVFRPAVRALGAYLKARDRAEAELVNVSDREQRRLAHDLHDGLCQQLVGIAFLVKSLAPNATDAQRAPLEEIGRLLADSIDQTRGLARALHSPALEAGGLGAALRELSMQTERVYGVKCTLRIDEAASVLDGDAANHLYRIAREAAVNAAKHGASEAIEIELSRGGATIQLAVRDDGVGIRPGPSDGLGLHMMEYRAKMIGAALEVRPRQGKGTVVTCSLAVPA